MRRSWTVLWRHRTSHLVSHTVGHQRPHHHAGRLPPNDAEAQTGAVVHQVDLLHVAPLLLQRHTQDVLME